MGRLAACFLFRYILTLVLYVVGRKFFLSAANSFFVAGELTMNIPTPCVCILLLSPVASLVASPTPTSPRRVAVVGAGIGGLALARALQTLDTGVEEVAVFDRRSELKPGVGGGIQINGGAAVLARLGLGEQMKASALPVRRILSRKSGGFELLDIDVESLVSAEPALVAPDGTPQAFSIMRDALQRILADSLPVGTVRLGQRLESLREDDAGVELLFEGGAAERFDLVVGADGATLHSAAPLTAPHIAPWHSARLCATTPQTATTPATTPQPRCSHTAGLSSRVREHVAASHAAEGGGGATPPEYSGIRVQFGVVPAGGARPAGSEGEFHQWFGEGVYALTGSYGTGAADGATSDMVAVVFADRAAGSTAALPRLVRPSSIRLINEPLSRLGRPAGELELGGERRARGLRGTAAARGHPGRGRLRRRAV